MSDAQELKIDRTAKTLRELALEKLRAAILDFRFRPGDRLVERTLAESLGVSRTVVREVLRNLESEGLVEIVPHQGPVVAKAKPEEIEQIYELRMMLEGAAASAAAETATPGDVEKLRAALAAIRHAYQSREPSRVIVTTSAFYEQLFVMSGKTVALSLLMAINSRINHLRALTISSEGRDVAGPAQMEEIITAIAEGDAAAARDATERHVTRAAAIARACLQAMPEEPPARKTF